MPLWALAIRSHGIARLHDHCHESPSGGGLCKNRRFGLARYQKLARAKSCLCKAIYHRQPSKVQRFSCLATGGYSNSGNTATRKRLKGIVQNCAPDKPIRQARALVVANLGSSQDAVISCARKLYLTAIGCTQFAIQLISVQPAVIYSKFILGLC